MLQNRKINVVRSDYSLLIAVLCLVVLGLAAVWSATSYRGDQIWGDSTKYMRDQLLRVSIGLVVMLFVAFRDYHRWVAHSLYFYAGSILMLLLLLTHAPFVVAQNGASSWMRIGPIMFQPSDFARYAMILFLAQMIHHYRDQLQDFVGGYLLLFSTVVVVVGLIAFEHDMGGAALTIMVAMLMFYFAEVPLSYLFATLLSLMTGAFAYTLLNPYMRKRITMFVQSLFEHKEGVNYQLQQSLITLAQGGFWGQGAGASHAKYYFLPMAHNDFIFALIGEEYGLIGTIGVLVIFMIIIQRGIRIAQHAPDGCGRLLAGGITACIGCYALINAGVVTGLLPTTGIPMPFLSYGGTAIVTQLFGVGLLLNISSQADPAFAKKPSWKTYQTRLNRAAFKSGGYMAQRFQIRRKSA